VSSVTRDEARERLKKGGWPRSSIAVILLAPLAVDGSLQDKDVGPAPLKDALLHVASAADTVGARALLMHVQDDNAKG